MGIRRSKTMVVNGLLKQVGVSFRTSKHNNQAAVFLCECGLRKVMMTGNVKHGRSFSCGCRELEQKTTHGQAKKNSRSSEYMIWTQIKGRCRNIANKDYASYGGRGISICERWMIFANFLEDVGPRPDSTSIDRINNSGNYEPGNVRWATATEQNRNTRRNRMLTANGMTKCLAEWEEEMKVKQGTLRARLSRGMSATEAVRGCE